MIDLHKLAFAVALVAFACKESAPRGGFACWREAAGTCEHWVVPRDTSRQDCERGGGRWMMACLTLDAVGNCILGGGQHQVFYSHAKFTLEQARAACTEQAHAGVTTPGGEPVFEFAARNEPDIRRRAN